MSNVQTAERTPKIIDAKLPLAWLIGSAFAITMSFGLLYGSVDRLVKDVGELQSTVKQGNAQTATLQGTLSVLQYRIETLERNLAQAGNAPVTQRPR